MNILGVLEMGDPMEILSGDKTATETTAVDNLLRLLISKWIVARG